MFVVSSFFDIFSLVIVVLWNHVLQSYSLFSMWCTCDLVLNGSYLSLFILWWEEKGGEEKKNVV